MIHNKASTRIMWPQFIPLDGTKLTVPHKSHDSEVRDPESKCNLDLVLKRLSVSKHASGPLPETFPRESSGPQGIL